MPMTQFSDTCLDCHSQIWLESETWIDNSGGDVCGINGDNELHNPSGDEIMIMIKEENNA